MTHILSCLTVGFLFRFWKFRKKSGDIAYNRLKKHTDTKAVASFSNLGSILQNSIMSSINTIIMIGGFVMLFSVIISILNNTKVFDILSMITSPILNKFGLPSSFAHGFFAGIVELTNGASLVAKIPFKAISVNMIICAFLLGFGGISILLQVLSITSTSDISIKPYIIAKLMQGAFSALYTYLLISNFTFLNFDL